MRLLRTSFCMRTIIRMTWKEDVLTYFQAHEKHKAYLKSLPSTSYPLEPTGSPVEVEENQRITEGAFEQR